MPSTPDAALETDVWQPQPPELLPPWHTPEREELQLRARRLAMEEVLPVSNELDPQKGEIPASLLDRLAELSWFGITVPAEHGGPADHDLRGHQRDPEADHQRPPAAAEPPRLTARLGRLTDR